MYEVFMGTKPAQLAIRQTRVRSTSRRPRDEQAPGSYDVYFLEAALDGIPVADEVAGEFSQWTGMTCQ
jgi:hypothetical protein